MTGFRQALSINATSPNGSGVDMTYTSQIETSFSGISDLTSNPPHNALAAGPGYIVTSEGARIAWTDLSGGSEVLQSIYQFFAPLGPTATNALFDPRAVFDPA